MAFPKTLEELKAAGYRFEDDAPCRGCNARVEWWRTPKGKLMPMNVDDKGDISSHFSTCPKAEAFRK